MAEMDINLKSNEHDYNIIIGGVLDFGIQSRNFSALIPITIGGILDYNIQPGGSSAPIPVTIDGLRTGFLADYDPDLLMVWDPYTLAEMDAGL